MSRPATKPSRFAVGEIWRGPKGALWRVTHLTSDGDAELREPVFEGRARWLRRRNDVPKAWIRVEPPQ